MKKQPLLSFFMVWIMLVTTTGCWDMEEIEERNQILAMAIDRVGKQHEVTIQVPIPLNIVGGKTGGGGGKPFKNLSMRGASLSEALNKLQDHMNRRLFLGHLELVIIGEKEAETGIQKFMDLLIRHFDVSRGLYPITVKGKAKDILIKENGIDPVSSIYLLDMVQTGVKTQTMYPKALRDLLNDLNNTNRRTPALNEFQTTADGYSWVGISVFKNDYKIGTLEKSNAIPLLHIREKKRGSAIQIQCPNKQGTIMFAPLDVISRINLKDDKHIQISVEVEGVIYEKTCALSFIKRPINKELEKKVEERYEAIAKKVIDRSQKVYKTDILELGNYFHAFRPRFYKNHHWVRDYPNIPIRIDYRVYIRRHGLET